MAVTGRTVSPRVARKIATVQVDHLKYNVVMTLDSESKISIAYLSMK